MDEKTKSQTIESLKGKIDSLKTEAERLWEDERNEIMHQLHGEDFASTPLTRAAHSGNVQEIRSLLFAGADINGKSLYGLTALMCAAQDGHLEAVKLLLNRGADTNAKSQYGDTALMRAVKDSKDPEIVQLLLDKGADPNAKNKDGDLPLTEAARSGESEIVKLLLNKGGVVNAQDKWGYTALMRAVGESGDLETVKLLLDKGANVRIQSKDGETALDMASKQFIPNDALIQMLKAAEEKQKKPRSQTPHALPSQYAEASVGFGEAVMESAQDVNTNKVIPLKEKLPTRLLAETAMNDAISAAKDNTQNQWKAAA